MHIHDMAHPDVHAVYRRLRSLVDSYHPERVLIGEVHLFDWDEWAAYYGADGDEMHLPFNFTLLYSPWEAGEVRARVDQLEAALPAGAWPNYVLGNHDEPRLATRFGPNRARVAAMLLLTLRGTPTIYYGDELGMQQVPVPPDRQQDPWAIHEPQLGRDGCRTPMQWDTTESAGFSSAAPTDLWLPLASDHVSVNVASQLSDRTSMLSLYRRLLAVRRGLPALHQGSYEPISATPAEIFAFVRSHGRERVCVVLNFSGQEARFVHDSIDSSEPLMSTTLERPVIDRAALTLRPFEGVILRV